MTMNIEQIIKYIEKKEALIKKRFVTNYEIKTGIDYDIRIVENNRLELYCPTNCILTNTF